jgi:hypothetical protein
MPLENESDKRRQEIRSDSYPMSIGELVSMYKEREIDIHPEFQRLYRWSKLQKTKLIESLLLGIPVPPIFVSQRDDGVWDVVDGVQRLSTIFEFMGLFVDDEGKLLPPSELLKTDYLASLEGTKWNDPGDPHHSFTSARQLEFKREKLQIVIIKRDSHPEAKYELFQRLNTLGTSLSDQEVRNCLLVMLDRGFYVWLKTLSDNDAFQRCLSLSDRLTNEQYHMELALRFFILKNTPIDELRAIDELAEFITLKMKKMVGDVSFNREAETEVFRRTFEFLDAVMGDDSFRKYDHEKGRFSGSFVISAFEIIGVGLGSCIDNWYPRRNEQDARASFQAAVKEAWRAPDISDRYGSGVRASTRIPALVEFGRRHFAR